MGHLFINSISCRGSNKEEGLVKQQFVSKDQSVKLTAKENQLVIVRTGKAVCSLDTLQSKEIMGNSFFMLPAGYTLTLSAGEDSQIMFLSICDKMQLHKSLSFNALQKHLMHNDNGEKNPVCLEIHPVLGDYLTSLETYLRCGLDSLSFLEAKITELFYILENFYKKEELAHFFEQYLTDDYRFKEQVRLNYRNARTVRELAGLLHYSYSGFNKRFKKVFQASAYSWMQEQRAKMVYRDLCLGDKSLKEISSDYSFVSLSHFNEFCHKELGASPGSIRRNAQLAG